MTTCERYAELDSAERYVAGRMTTDEGAEFEQHFLACDACLATVKGIEDVRDVLVERRAALGRGEVDPLGGDRTRLWSGWAAAAAFAAAASLIAGIFWMRGGAPSSGQSVESPAPTDRARSAARAFHGAFRASPGGWSWDWRWRESDASRDRLGRAAHTRARAAAGNADDADRAARDRRAAAVRGGAGAWGS